MVLIGRSHELPAQDVLKCWFTWRRQSSAGDDSSARRPNSRTVACGSSPTVTRVCEPAGAVGRERAEALLAAVVSVVVDDVGLVLVLGVAPDLVAAVDARGDEASIG